MSDDRRSGSRPNSNILAFARRLLEVVRAAQHYQALRIEGCSDTTDEWIELSRKIDAFERDYPGVLEEKRDE